MEGISTFDIGGRGEDIAMQWLREHGFLIVERNWRIGHYEIDIIAQHYDTLHFVEVKTRKEGGWQTAYDSINESKIRSLRRGAMAFRTIRRIPLNLQFDLIAVIIDDHNHHTIEYTKNIL
jgi:putative endonuclease